MELELPIWQIAFHKNISLNEIRHNWTYADLLKAQAIIQMEQDYEMAQNEITREETKT